MKNSTRTDFSLLRNFLHQWLLLLFLVLFSVSAKALHWIGPATGDWNDPANWSTTINGTSCNCVPDEFTDAIFDFVTPSVVNIDPLTAMCKDFVVNGGIALTVNSATTNRELWVHGNFQLQPTTNWVYNGFVWFKANTTVFIDPALNFFNNRIYFDDPGGDFQVISELLSNDNVVHRFGVVTLHDGGTIGGYFSNFTNNSRELHLNNTSNKLTLRNQFVSGDIWSYAWRSFDGLDLTQDPLLEIECTADEVYFWAEHLVFQNVNVSHNGNPGHAVIRGLNDPLQTSFNELTLGGNAQIMHDNDIRTKLDLKLGGHYRFQAGTTQNFQNTGGIQALSGPPFVYAVLESYGGCSNQTYFSHLDWQPNLSPLDRLAIKNIKVINTSPIPIPVTNGIDLGGAVNWQMPPASSFTFTWIGGGGSSWFNPANWNPGGSSNLLPSPLDDVVFDNAPIPAWRNVQVDQLGAHCRNMDWSSSGSGWNFTSSSSANRLLVYGSQTMPLAGNVNSPGFDGFVYYGGNLGGGTNLITSNTYKWKNDVYFGGCGGKWKLQDQFETEGLTSNTTISSQSGGIVYLEQGYLDVSNQTLRALSFNSLGTSTRTLHMPNATIELMGNENPYYSRYAWDFVDGHGQNGLTMHFGNDVAGSIIHFYGNGSLNAPISNGQVLHRVTFHTIGRIHGSNVFRHHVHFMSDGTIGYPANPTASNASNIFRRQLRLEPGKAYVVEIGEEQRFIGNNSTIVTNGTCANYTQIRSSKPNVHTKLTNLSAGTITLDYCILKDLDGTGGIHSPNFQCNNSLGYNLTVVPSDWNISGPSTTTALYWIGGNMTSISWSDPNNWSLSSGGPPNVDGCIPSPTTDAIFDDQGFNHATPGSYVVEVDVCNAYVHNMIWKLSNSSGINVEFRDNNQVAVLWVYGYWEMCDQSSCGSLITNNYDAAISFETDGDPADYLAMDPPLIFKSDLYFRGVGKTWTQRTDITTTKDEWLEAGRHFTAEKDLTVDQFTGYDDGVLDLSDLIKPTFTLTGTATNTPLRYTYQSFDGFQLWPGESEILFTNNNRPSLKPEFGTAFYNVTFTDPNTYAEVYADNGGNLFNDLTFLGSAEINCDNEYLTELEFSPAKTYILKSGVLQHFVGAADFNSMGSLGNIITILSSTTGQESFMLKDQPHVCIDYVSLRDNHNISVPGVIFSAGNNSTNWTNNSGWTFASFPVKDPSDCYYPDAVTICDQMPFTFAGPTGAIVSWNWDLGNGTSSTLQNPVATYNTPGTYWIHCDVVYTNGVHNRFLYELVVDDCCQQSDSQWPRQGGDLAPGIESGNDVDVDHDGNVYICGQNLYNASFGPFTLLNQYGFAASYDECGVERWAVSLPGEPIARRLKYSLVQNRVYVITDNGHNEVDVICLNAATGATVWVQTINTTGGAGAKAGSIDVFGNDIYVCGTFSGTLNVPGLSPIIPSSPTADRGFLAVYSGGFSTWSARILEPNVAWQDVSATGVAVHTNGHVSVVGQASASLNFGAGGVSPWIHNFLGPEAYIAQFDPLLVHYTSFVSTGRNNYLEVAFDYLENQVVAINGNTSPAYVDTYDATDFTLIPLWVSPPVFNDYYQDIHINASNGHAGIYVSGRDNSGGNDRSIIKKFDLSTGAFIYKKTSTNVPPPILGSSGNGVVTSLQGHLTFITGTFTQTTSFGTMPLATSGFGDFDVFTARLYEEISNSQFYKFDVAGLTENPEASLQVFPNPTTGQLNVEILLPQEEAVTIQLVDFYGRIILEHDYGQMDSRTVMLNLSGQASGIYYLHVQSDQRNLSQKVILAD